MSPPASFNYLEIFCSAGYFPSTCWPATSARGGSPTTLAVKSKDNKEKVVSVNKAFNLCSFFFSCVPSLNEYGLGLALVMKYAVDEINGNRELLPGIKLGYEIYDTCKQSAVIVKPTMSFLTAKSNRALSVECNYTDYETSISAVIGPVSSEMVSVIGKLLGFFLMPQVWLWNDQMIMHQIIYVSCTV